MRQRNIGDLTLGPDELLAVTVVRSISELAVTAFKENFRQGGVVGGGCGGGGFLGARASFWEKTAG